MKIDTTKVKLLQRRERLRRFEWIAIAVAAVVLASHAALAGEKSPVPTLSEWGELGLAIGLGAAGVVAILRITRAKSRSENGV